VTAGQVLRPGAPMALEGIRVLDLTWVIAGPVATRFLADFGAEVIKLESERSMDPGRMGGPWLHGINTAPDGGGGFTLLNRNKLGATLNLKHPEGKELFKRLAAVSDVVVNNYSAGTMDGFGLGWEVLREVNPRLVMAEMSGMGQEGPYREHFCYGHTLLAVGGEYDLTGYPDGPPIMPGYTYADFASPTIGAFAIVSALISRQTTGKGQYIDLAQVQMTASLTSEAQLAALAGAPPVRRMGNHEPGAMVSGCFRCAGDDQWCVIVVRTEEEWRALRSVAGEDRLPAEADEWDTLKVEAAIEKWTQRLSAREVMETLQAAGVEAGRVQNARDLVEDDEHLRERGYFTTYQHLLGEEAFVDGVPFKMSATPGSVRRAGPGYGIDNEYVFGDILGLPLAEIVRLREAGVIA
jgi:crotonobetainyl-CoA:carnitine CoA-transferase CaiB-like acyl-CoA transferase